MLARKIDNVLRADGKQFDADTGREDSMASRAAKIFECLGIAAERDTARRGEHLQQLEIARMQPKGKR